MKSIVAIALAGGLILGGGVLPASADQKGPAGEGHLKGNRIVIGTVQEVRANELKVNTGEVQPRFIPVKPGAEKGMSFQPGDKLVITLNEHNLLVDYHKAGAESRHRIIRGRISDNLTVGHDTAVIETSDGKKEQYKIQSPVRSKMAAIPAGTDAEFLIDETNQIADAQFANVQAAMQASQDRAPQPIKGNQRRVEGTVVKPLDHDRIGIKTNDGKEQTYAVRPLAKDKLAKAAPGDLIILLVDPDNAVVDVAATPKG